MVKYKYVLKCAIFAITLTFRRESHQKGKGAKRKRLHARKWGCRGERRVNTVLVCHPKWTARATRADAVGFNYPTGKIKCLTCSKSSDITRRRALLTAGSTAPWLRTRHQRLPKKCSAQGMHADHTQRLPTDWNSENYSRIELVLNDLAYLAFVCFAPLIIGIYCMTEYFSLLMSNLLLRERE